MDVDLSTDLNALLPLVAPLLSGHSDVAIGSRLSRSARVVRGPKRELISRSYNLLLRTTLRARFSDAQCGFKAMRAECARALLPHVRDTSWFFDTELLVLAERSGLRIAEVPVDWIDDPDSRVDIVSTAVADLRGVARLAGSLLRGDLPVRDLRAQLGQRRRRAGVAAAPGDPLRRRRRAVDARLPRAVPAVPRSARCAGREPARAARHRGRQHRGQSAIHVRRVRTWCRASSSCKVCSCSRSAWPHQRLARPALAAQRASGPTGRGARADRRQPGRDGAALRPAPRMGLRTEGMPR